MTAPTWSRWDHLGKFRLYIPLEKRKGFLSQPASMNYDSRGWRVTRPDDGESWSTYHPIRLGRVGGPDIVADDGEPIYEPVCEWLPLRLQRFAARFTEPRRWLGVPLHKGARPWTPQRYPVPDAWMPPYREPRHIEPKNVLGNLHTLSRLASAWARTADPVWQRRALAWQWWRDFRQPVSGYGSGDPKEYPHPDSTNPKSRPTITEMMRAAGWTGSEKTGWDTTTAAQQVLTYFSDPIPSQRDRKMWFIELGSLVFGEFVEWGTNNQNKYAAFPKVGLLSFGMTKKGRGLSPRDERGLERKPAATTIDGVKWPRPEYQKRWASELRSYLGLRGAVPYYAEPYQRPINPPAIGYGEAEYPKAPIRPEVEAARKFLSDRGVDGSVPLAQARANAGLQPLPDKHEKTHTERYAEFEARLARYRAGENVRLVEPRDLGDAIILGVGKDGSVDTKVWRGGVIPLPTSKPARIDADGWIADKIDRGDSDKASTESPDDIETGGLFLDRLGEYVEILDDAISAVTAERIARGKGLAPEYAKVEGARMVDRALDNLYALLHPVAEKTRTLVADNDNRNNDQKIAA